MHFTSHLPSNHDVVCLSSLDVPVVLKTVENLGVSYVKLSEPYIKKLDFEFKNLNFPYRVDAVSTTFDSCVNQHQ